MYDPFAHFETHTLANGATVYAAYLPERPVQIVNFVIDVGHYHGQEGLAHYVEHIVAHSARTGEAHKKRLELKRLGGVFKGGTTGMYRTEYGFLIPAKLNLEEYCAKMFAYVFQPSWEHDDAKEKSIFAAERQERVIKRPIDYKRKEIAILNLRPGHFDNSVNSLKVLFGEPEKIENRTLEEVTHFHRRYYAPQNLKIFTIGPMPVKEVLQILNNTGFYDLTANAESIKAPKIPDYSPVAPKLQRAAFYDPDAKSATLRSSFVAPLHHFPVESLAIRIFSYHLQEILREKNAFVYSCRCSIGDLGGAVLWNAEADGIDIKNVEHVNDAYGQVAKMVADREIVKDLERIKEEVMNTEYAREFTVPSIMESAQNRLKNFDRIITQEDLVHSYQSVTLEQVLPLLKKFDPDQAYYRWVLPPSAKSPSSIPVYDFDQALDALRKS